MIRTLKDGLRDALLRGLGEGKHYQSLRNAEVRAKSSELRVASLELELERLSAALRTKAVDEAALQARLTHFDGLREADRLIELDFPIRPRVRAGWGNPSYPQLERLLAADQATYAERIREMLPLVGRVSLITQRTDDPAAPHWINDWLPGFDAFSLYATLVLRRPATVIEIGSGVSTKFARRAIQDYGLPTRIVSVDPSPRAEIDAICDTIVRHRLEDTSLDVFNLLTHKDIVFFDGSHRSFQNSDATVFFLEVLPMLPSGVLIGVHDIFLPDDYPPQWLTRFYSEQYLLASWMLGGNRIRVHLPVWYCSKIEGLRSLLSPLWDAPNFQGANIHGGIFWFTVG
jgi:Methyltransferase domain